MSARSTLTSLAALAATTALIASVWAVRHALRGVREASAPGSPALVPAVLQAGSARPEEPGKAPNAPLAGLDLARIGSDAAGLVAPTEAGTAHLTVDPELQRIALGLMSAHHLPEAAVVLMDVATGKLLVYASHLDKGPPRDLCAEATAPSASVFKIVTAAALLEDAHLGPDTQQCYSGGESRINAIDLVDDPRRDRWCTTLAGAMGRSINTVFARLAGQRLVPPQLEAMARRFGYGEGVPFDVPVQPGELHVPSEPLDFARTAAGFWNTTLSPVQAAEMSAIVARGGETVRPAIVERVVSPAGAVIWNAPAESASHRAVARETAEALTTMMDHTVSEGTSWRAFHDPHGTAFLPGIEVAGKTGTLTDNEAHRYYTWFTGFAPARAAHGQTPAQTPAQTSDPSPDQTPGVRQVAVAALVVNGPAWQVKANLVAREMLRAYFASQGIEGVTRPSIAEVARRTRAHAP